jgi:hypothetical protein
MATGDQALALSRSAQLPAKSWASDGSSLRSKAKTEAVLRVLSFWVAMVFFLEVQWVMLSVVSVAVPWAGVSGLASGLGAM